MQIIKEHKDHDIKFILHSNGFWIPTGWIGDKQGFVLSKSVTPKVELEKITYIVFYKDYLIPLFHYRPLLNGTNYRKARKYIVSRYKILHTYHYVKNTHTLFLCVSR